MDEIVYIWLRMFPIFIWNIKGNYMTSTDKNEKAIKKVINDIASTWEQFAEPIIVKELSSKQKKEFCDMLYAIGKQCTELGIRLGQESITKDAAVIAAIKLHEKDLQEKARQEVLDMCCDECILRISKLLAKKARK